MEIPAKYITDYIDFLHQYGLTVTLHGTICNCNELIMYIIHQNPYCHYIKSLHNVNICSLRQGKVYDKCAKGDFFGVCFAGVSEYVYPVLHEGSVVGFISVSGYLTESPEAEEKLRHFSEKFNANYDTLQTLRHQYLKTNIPKKETVDTLIHPLISMLELFYAQSNLSRLIRNQLYVEMLYYISENYHQQITMQTLSRHLNFSVSTLSHIFKKNCSKSLPEYVEILRLKEAKQLLRESNTAITEISNMLGFCSSNYFSTVFKKHFDITPRQYRLKFTSLSEEEDVD